MPVNDTERLAVLLEARIKDFERSFQKANATARKNFGEIEARASVSTKRLETGFASAGKAIQSGFGFLLSRAGIAGLGITGIATAFVGIAGSIADIGREAKRAGVDLKSFQELKFLAENAKIPVDALTDGMKELSLRADEFIVTGKGSSAEAFQRLGFNADSLREKLQKPSDLLVEIVARLQTFSKAAQIRIADELFGGTAGERFVELLDQGADGIREQIAEANRLGVVLDKDIIAKATEVDRQFRIISQTISTNFKGAIVEAASALGDFIEQFRSFDGQRTATLDNELAQIGMRRLEIETQILKLRDQQRNAVAGSPFGVDYASQIAVLQGAMDDLADRERRVLEALRTRPASTAAPARETTVAASTAPAAASNAHRSASAKAAERERASIADLTAELMEELRLLTATDAERRAADASRKAGAAATDEQRAAIIALNGQIFQMGTALQQAADARSFFAENAADALGSVITGASSAEDAIGHLTDAFIRAAIQSALLGTGPLSGLTGGKGLFMASGGPVKAATGGFIRGPGTSTSDSIPALLSDGEFVVKASAAQRHQRLLQAINSGSVPRYAIGGSVGASKRESTQSPGVVSISPNINLTVQGSRDPKADDALAANVGKQVEGALRSIVADELRTQMRPGNLLGPR